MEVDQLCKYLKSSAGIGDGRLPCVCVCMCVCVCVCVCVESLSVKWGGRSTYIVL